MDNRSWWRKLLDLPALWRWRRSQEYRDTMADYWNGTRCRFCSRYDESECPVPHLDVCDFWEGK